MSNIPVITTQYDVCPIPYKLDTYMGCCFLCRYCFARITVEFNRKIAGTNVKGIRPFNYDIFERWIKKTINSEIDYSKPNKVAFLERIPIKVGGNCDPFPLHESRLQITRKALSLLHNYDYPVQILTKNPKGLYDCFYTFDNPNWALSISLISSDKNFIKEMEINTPSPNERLLYIEKLVKRGGKVIVKIQPAIYPFILSHLPDLVRAIKNSGAYGFNIEGLKAKPADTYLHDFNVRKHMQRLGGIDLEIKLRYKLEYIKMAEQLAEEHDLKLFIADNYIPGKHGCSSECCGTEVLRNYKIFGFNEKTKKFGLPAHHSKEFAKCNINHMHRDSHLKHTTFENEHNKKKGFGL